MRSLIFLALVLAPMATANQPSPPAAPLPPDASAPPGVNLVLPEPVPFPMPAPSADVVAPASPSASAWVKDAGTFEPDVYASPRAAARALGARWAKQAAAPESAPPAKVVLLGVPGELRGELIEGLRAHLPAAEIRSDYDLVRDGPEPACSEARLTFSMTPPREPEGRPTADGDEAVAVSDLNGHGGRMVVRSYQSPRRPAKPRTSADLLPAQAPGSMEISAVRGVSTAAGTASVRFVDKPWVEEFAAYASAHPGRWVVGRSQPTSTSASEAADRALREAADQLARLAEARLNQYRFVRDRHGAYEALRAQAYMQLQRDAFIADRLVQQFDRPYGSTWAGAVLVDASPQAVETLASLAGEEIGHRHANAARTFAAGLVLVLVTFVLYKLVNAYTRGYFTWSLRTAAVAVLAAGVLLLMVVG